MTTRRARSGRPALAQGGPRPLARVARVAEQGDPADRRERVAVEPAELRVEAAEDVALGRPEAGPGDEVADVAGGHAERVRHDLRQVGGALAVEDAGDRRGQEPVDPVVQVGATSGRTGAGRTSAGWKLRATSTGTGSAAAPSSPGRRPLPAVGTSAPSGPGIAEDAEREPEPGVGLAGPAQPERGQPGPRLGLRGRLDLGRGQQVGERVEIVADADPALRTGLERGRPTAAERVEDDVPGPRVAGDEGVGQGGREARQVRAHRVEPVAPQPLLILPFGRDRQRRELVRSDVPAGRGRAAPRRARGSRQAKRSASSRHERAGKGGPGPSDPCADPGGTTGRGA